MIRHLHLVAFPVALTAWELAAAETKFMDGYVPRPAVTNVIEAPAGIPAVKEPGDR